MTVQWLSVFSSTHFPLHPNQYNLNENLLLSPGGLKPAAVTKHFGHTARNKGNENNHSKEIVPGNPLFLTKKDMFSPLIKFSTPVLRNSSAITNPHHVRISSLIKNKFRARRNNSFFYNIAFDSFTSCLGSYALPLRLRLECA